MEQAILHVHFVPHLDDGTVEPACPQYGGVQGDRNGAVLSFFVPLSLRESRFRYRIEGEDGAGGFIGTEFLPLDDEGNVSLFLDERFTAAGGQILVRLVVSEVQDDNEIALVRSFDGRLFFADAPVPNTTSPFRDTLSAMVVRNEQKLEEMQALSEELTECVGEVNARAGAMEAVLNGHGSRLTAVESDLEAAVSRLAGDEQTADELDGWVQRIYDGLQNLGGTAELKEDEATPWKFIQKIVRAGLAKKLFSVGDVLISDHADYGKIVWEVVGFDHDTLMDDRFSHSMTLQAKDCLHTANGQYDLKEFAAATPNYSSGFADWETCALRTWLNSQNEGGEWFFPSSEEDASPTYAAQDGFLHGFSKSFLEAIGTVEIPVALNSSFATHSGTTYDKIFLPSRVELFATQVSGNAHPYEGEVREKYGAEHSSFSDPANTADANRVKKLNNTEEAWWTRSINPMVSSKATQVKADGSILAVAPTVQCAVAPMCCIY